MHLFRRADELDEDPLHGSLVGLKMLSEMMADLPAGHPGCLVAACYQDCLFDREVRDLYTSAMLGKRRRFRSYRDFGKVAVQFGVATGTVQRIAAASRDQPGA
jgi:TetR/AcrR family transcriptional regulator, transcriptional repressor for nem operon